MNNTTELIIAGKSYSLFTEYTIESNIYNAAGEFRFKMHPKHLKTVASGNRCVIKIDGVTAMNGIIDRRALSGDKDKEEFTVTGRDLMGMVVDRYIETYRTLRGKTLREVAELYLGQIDYVKKLDIQFIDGADNLDIAQEYVQPQPGMTVFDLLSGIATARGINFYMRPDGTIVFGKPRGFGSHTFALWRTDGRQSNILRGNFIDDISQRYSRITVVGQEQSTFDIGAASINKKAVVTDPDFPFEKPLVIETGTAAMTADQQARMIMEQQRFAGFAVQYTTGGHTQRGSVWSPDSICAVDDYKTGIQEEMIVYGRSFELSKRQKTTTVTLGKMGFTA